MAQTSYNSILAFNKSLEEKIGTTSPFGLEKFPSAIIIEKASLQRIIDEAEAGVLASFGIENGKFTVSFLGLDTNNKILCSHITGLINGEETWPAESVTNFPATIDTFDPGNC